MCDEPACNFCAQFDQLLCYADCLNFYVGCGSQTIGAYYTCTCDGTGTCAVGYRCGWNEDQVRAFWIGIACLASVVVLCCLGFIITCVCKQRRKRATQTVIIDVSSSSSAPLLGAETSAPPPYNQVAYANTNSYYGTVEPPDSKGSRPTTYTYR